MEPGPTTQTNLAHPRPQGEIREVARRALEGTLGIPFSHGNRLSVLRNGVEIFPAMLEAIEGARHSVELLTFVYWKGEIARRFAEALSVKAREGVRVKLLLDGWGARPMDLSLVEAMEAAGVEVVWFRPVSTWRVWKIGHRTHRKILVVDGQVGFTGGVGIAQEWEGDARNPDEWRETHFRLEGPVVHGLRAAFLGNWQEADRDLPFDVRRVPDLQARGDVDIQVVRATASIGFSDVTTLMRVLPRIATHRLRITTGYFVPDQKSVDLLCEAAGRGVEIDILLPGPHTDQRFAQLAGMARYEPLIEAGVRLWAYQPTMIHAKIAMVDGLLSVVGSANFNHRSMRHDDEVSLSVLDEETTRILDRHFEADLDRSRPLSERRWSRRPLAHRVAERIAHPFRHQM